MDCRICFDKYNKFNRKPIVLLPCCHTFCMSCLINLKKTSDSLSCPKCRKHIGLFKPNYGILEIIDDKRLDSKLVHQMSRTESVSVDTVEKFYSSNHDHNFEIDNDTDDESWICDGFRMLGACKSDKLNKEMTVCYRCTLCNDFKLCQLCLDEPQKKTSDFFYSDIHEHRLVKCDSDEVWMCNGMVIFGKCKSNIDNFGLNKNVTRYICTECIEFDLCQACLDSEELVGDKVKIDNENESLDLSCIFNEN
jgi:hypothetical protein